MGSGASSFSVKQIQDLTGKIAIVTGGNSGIGYAIAKALASKGATVIVASRSLERVNEAVEKLQSFSINKTVFGMVLDISAFSSIDKFVTAFKSKYSKIDFLINNAGVFIPPFCKTEQGFEVNLGTNAFGTQYLTNLLLPLVMKSDAARVVYLSSATAAFADVKTLERYLPDLGGTKLTQSTIEAYGMSKTVVSMCAWDLQRRLDEAGVRNVLVNAVDPGTVSSGAPGKIDNMALRSITTVMFPLIAKSIDQGAISALYAATQPIAPAMRGETFGEGPKVLPFKWPKKGVFTPENCARVFDVVDKEITSRGFTGFEGVWYGRVGK
eukprot:gene30751-38010_t